MAMRRDLFNFRDVLNAIGVPPVDNATNWKAGNLLRKFFADMGIEPARELAEKTNPNASVSAPHVIAHYPMKYYPDAIECLRKHFEDLKRQGQLPL